MSKSHLKSQLRVLLVEDDEFSQLVAEVALRNVGALFQSVTSGEAALDLLDRISQGVETPGFDFVLMDFKMPGIDGLEATRRIRSHGDSRIQKLPVVGLSGSKSFEDQRQALESGMNVCIGKPVSAATLKKVFVDLQPAPQASSSGNFATGSVLDERTLNYLREETSEELVRKVVQSFLKNLPNYIDQISQGLAQQRNELIQRYAHILKASSGTVGAVKLFDLACRLEDFNAKEPDLDLYALVQTAKQESERAVHALTAYLTDATVKSGVVSL